jgi:hypothetical protein
MTMLMMLSFLIDQVQQLCCQIYQKARKHVGRLSTLFVTARPFLARHSERSEESPRFYVDLYNFH